MQRDKTEQRKSELKSESCPVLSRQSLAQGGHEEVPQCRGGPLGRGCHQKGTREAAVFSFFKKSR